MEIKRIKVQAELIILIQADDTIDMEMIEKATILAEMEINSKIAIIEDDDAEFKVMVRCHTKEII